VASTTVVLFTRDLRVHDNPALHAAAEGATDVVPLFVLDDDVLARFGAPNRVAFLLDALADLRQALLERGGSLVVRRGDAVVEAIRLARQTGAERIHLSEDVSAFAQERLRRLRRTATEHRITVEAFPGITVVPPGDIAPAGSSAYRVFTPYWKRWHVTPWRAVLPAPARIGSPSVPDDVSLPSLDELARGDTAAGLPPGGETEGRARLARWLRAGLADYESRRDDLAVDGTSGLSPYLHLGCVSPLEVAVRSGEVPGGDAFVRQLCWRDFHHQLLAAEPRLAREELHPRHDRWRDDPETLAAWKEGRTGYPLVDAGMRQLRAEGTMHNRARLVTASFLVKHLYLDWRLGAAHFAEHLVDGDVANNVGNWQWVAGTGADTRPNRVFNPIRQARRFDPDGAYVRRWVPELEAVDGADVHEPWRLDRPPPDYPPPIVDHAGAVSRFLEARRTR
jgi:deoxyribodipyrimidine photo-lyase